VNKEAYAPWERGFDSDRLLQNEPSRFGEFKIKRRLASSSTKNNPVLLLNRAQWQERRRTVVAGSEAKKVVVSKAGHPLRLFSFEQTT
jgi:hypothetical protein